MTEITVQAPAKPAAKATVKVAARAAVKTGSAAHLTDPAISALIRHQHGVLTAAQAAAHGLPHETLRRRVQRGIWQRVLPGLYVLQCGPPNTVQWSIAALLYAGEDSILTGPAALAAHRLPIPRAPSPPRTTLGPAAIVDRPRTGAMEPAGHCDGTPEAGAAPAGAGGPAGGRLAGPAAAPGAHPAHSRSASPAGQQTANAQLPYSACASVPRLDVLVPHRMRRQNIAGIRIMRTAQLPSPVELGPLRFAPLAKALVDTCLIALEGGERAVVDLLIASALADGRVGLAELEDALGQAPRRNASALRAHLSRHRGAARRAAEHRLLTALRLAGPPDALLDVAVYEGGQRIAQASALWPRRAVAAMVDGPEHEVQGLARLGFAVLRIEPPHVTHDLAGVLRQIESVLRERPEAAVPQGVALLPRTTAASASAPRPAQTTPSASQPAPPAQSTCTPQAAFIPAQRTRTVGSLAGTGCASPLPRGETGQP